MPAEEPEIAMPKLMESPPHTPIDAVAEILHGASVTDPYRWLEDQDSPRTRQWLAAQVRYARSYLDAITDRDRIRKRVRDLVDVETYDSIQIVGKRYFFRKRLPAHEQPCIFLREGPNGEDQILVDPAERGTGEYTAVKPLRVSPDGGLLLYEVKEGGERTGTFELLDLKDRKALPDVLPRGYLRGFAFTPDSRGFYYVHEAVDAKRPHYRAAYRHILGTVFSDDQEIFLGGDSQNLRLRIVPGKHRLGFLVTRLLDNTHTDFYAWKFESEDPPEPVIQDAQYHFGPLLLDDGRILAITDREASNFRIVEVRPQKNTEAKFVDLIPAADSTIQSWIVTEDRIFVSYIRELRTAIDIFDLSGRRLGQLPTEEWETVRLAGSCEGGNELLFERESFTKPIQICSYLAKSGEVRVWAERKVPFDSRDFSHAQVWFTGKDGVRIPMFLMGRRDVLESGSHPTIMTAYGGYGVSMTPQFSVFVAFLTERGCLFALPNIRGGSEFGMGWHEAAKRRNRQVAFDDFLSAAEWLIDTGRAEPQKLAIFGGSNSGLLVGAAMTQQPHLFKAVVCIAPMLDMLRYHLFDNAHVWKDEFGTVDDAGDFEALFGYSPYHRVHDDTAYPATMIVSGDCDQNCNPLHARKMTARLQAANVSGHPILLDYSQYRGHSPVLPLTERVEALTDRMAFLCSQLQLPV
jgi:prolyl oligopeptidase